jgi:glucose-6-phosphate-specific signal transduction histidine kinase
MRVSKIFSVFLFGTIVFRVVSFAILWGITKYIYKRTYPPAIVFPFSFFFTQCLVSPYEYNPTSS